MTTDILRRLMAGEIKVERADVLAVVSQPGWSHFLCPRCKRKVRVQAWYWKSWRFKTCPGCDATWANVTWVEGGEVMLDRADESAVGEMQLLKLAASGDA